MDFCLLEHLETLVYSTHVHNEETLHNRIVGASRTVRSYPGNFERTWRSFLFRVAACIESNGRYFEHYYE
jgi:hypothetical protein